MKKFIMALTAYATKSDVVKDSPPPIELKMPVIDMAAPAVMVMDYQCLDVVTAPVVFISTADAPITSQMASQVMAAYIDRRNYFKIDQPPNSKRRNDWLNQQRYYNRLHSRH